MIILFVKLSSLLEACYVSSFVVVMSSRLLSQDHHSNNVYKPEMLQCHLHENGVFTHVCVSPHMGNDNRAQSARCPKHMCDVCLCRYCHFISLWWLIESFGNGLGGVGTSVSALGRGLMTLIADERRI